jgi:hypothetical protein
MNGFDLVFKLVSMASGIGIFVGVGRLVVWAIQLEPRIEHIETQTAEHGAMLQQFTKSQARIEGILAGLFEGSTETQQLRQRIRAAIEDQKGSA